MRTGTRPAAESAVLTIAGSDCSGGAGIQADLKTFAAHGCYGASVLTALTAQNTTGVQGVCPIPPSFVAQQIHSVLDDVDIHAIKTGMLYDAAVAQVVANELKTYKSIGKLPPVVCDPVCVSTSGHTLLNSNALDVLIQDLFPQVALITPNKSETELLLTSCGSAATIDTLEDMLLAAETLSTYCATAVLTKGGHFVSSLQDVENLAQKYPELDIIKQNIYTDNMEILQVGLDNEANSAEMVVDVLYQRGGEKTLYVRPRIDSTNTHGTGCTLSAAIACGLARGVSLRDAVAEGAIYTHVGIATAQPIGNGCGPLNHLHSLNHATISKRTPVNPYPFTHFLIHNTRDAWKAYVEHDFVKQLGKGTLLRQRFLHFIKQDYHYLKYYARAYGLLAAKSSTFPSIDSATQIIVSVLNEIGTHRTFCQTFGITPEELENATESTATTAYGAYIINVGLQGDQAKLIMALMACLLGYGEVGLWLKKESTLPNSWVVLEGNPYKKWIDDYSGEHYQSAVRLGLETLEQMVVHDHPSPVRLKAWQDIWLRCTQLEKGFWDMAMELSM